MVEYEDRVKVFENELRLILDENIREFTKLCLSDCPDYIFIDCPASTTGKYHPIDELGSDGTIIHTKKVVTMAYTLCRGLGCEDRRDEIVSACIIHDLVKRGLNGSRHTTRDHPAKAAELVERVQEMTSMLPQDSFEIIKNAVGYHYGLWSDGVWLKPLDKYTTEELCVYISDYVASKREFVVKYERGTP